MLRNKIIAIVTCGVLVTAGITGATLISNNNKNNNKTIENHVLLTAPNLNNLAVVINTNKNPLVLYSSPNANSNIESYISVGEMLNYTATSNPNFYKVTVQETGASGYISASDMQIIESGLNKAYENMNKNGQVINVTYDVKLMSSPDVHSQILGSYKNDTPITILGKQDQWYKVKIGNQTGYIYGEYVGIDINKATSNATTNNQNQTNTSNKNITVSEKMITQNGSVVVPTKSIYNGDNFNPQDIQNLTLPNGYELVKFNIYNNGNMIETGGTQTTDLNNLNLGLPTANHLNAGNLLIEYIVKKIPSTTNQIKSCAVTVKTLNAQGKQVGTISSFNANNGSSYTPAPSGNIAGQYVNYISVNGVKSTNRTVTIDGATNIVVQLANYDTTGKEGNPNISCAVTVKTLNAQGKQVGTISSFNANDGSSYTPAPSENIAGQYVNYILVNGVKSPSRTITINGSTNIIVQLASYDN